MCHYAGFGGLFLLGVTLVFSLSFFSLPNHVHNLSPLQNETIQKSCRFLALSEMRKAIIAV